MPSKKSPDGAGAVEEIARATGSGPRSHLRVLVLAAHPDDETLGASAVLGRCAFPAVAFLTDGAPRNPQFRPGWNGSREAYAAARRQEALTALSLAQVPPSAVFWLGGTDLESVFQLETLISQCMELMLAFAPQILVTHPYEGGHPDHDSAALVASASVTRLHGRKSAELLEMTSYHARGDRRITGEFLHDAGGHEWNSGARLVLDREERDRKARMLSCYATQQAVLREFPLEPERLRPAPSYDFSRPPHDGLLWYERLGWPISGQQWREQATLLLAQL